MWVFFHISMKRSKKNVAYNVKSAHLQCPLV
jgi:hypothetical protein